MDFLRDEEAVDVLLLLNRDTLDTLQLTTKRLQSIVAECLNDDCLRFFDVAELSKSHPSAELSFIIRGDTGSMCLKGTKSQIGAEFLNFISMFAKYLRMAAVGELSVLNFRITSDLVDAMNNVSSTLSVYNLTFSWIRFGVEFGVFHSFVLGFRSVEYMHITTTHANCVNDTLLTGLATKGSTTFEQSAGVSLYSQENRPQCGIGEAALLDFCFGERANGGNVGRRVKLDYMHVSNEFFAKVIHTSKQSRQANDVEIEIKTSSRVAPKFPPELQITPVVQGRDANVYHIAFVDGNPREITVRLVFHDVHARVPARPCYRKSKVMSKRLPGRFYRDKLNITFT